MGRLEAAAIGSVLGLLALYPEPAMEAVRSACLVWARSVMPALFPYMVFSQLLCARVQAAWLTPVLAMLGGSPAGARLLAQKGYPAPRAQSLAALCTTVSPLFILGALRGGVLMLSTH